MKKMVYIIIPTIIIAATLSARFLFSNFQDAESDAEAATTRTGLVGHWTMDSGDINGTKMYDKSGKANNGTIYNGHTTVLGKIKQAKSFVGASYHYIDLGKTASLNFEYNTPFSGAVWIKPSTLGEQLYPVIISNVQSSSPNRGWDFLIYSSTGRLNLQLISTWSSNTLDVLGTKNVIDGQWHHVAFTYDGTYTSGGVKFYVDGVNDPIGTINYNSLSATISNSTVLSIGIRSGGVYPFTGQMDDFRIYDRTLSAQEVADLYNSAKINFTNTATRASSTPSAGKQLVGYWDMDANNINGTTVYDKSGKGYNGTRAGAAGANNTPKIVAGKIKQALDFDLSDDTVTISNYPANFGTGDMSLSVWFQTTTSTGTTAPIINNEVIGALNSGFGMNMYAGSPYIYFALDDGVANPSVFANNYAVNDGKWHHAVGVRDKSTNLMKIYLDGVFDNSGADTTNDISSSDDLIFGSYYSGGLNYRFNGQIDEIRIYNYALSAQEVAGLYNAAKTNFTNTPSRTGLVGHWTMDNTDRSRNLIYDKSGFNNNGTLIGTTTSTGRIKEARNFNGTSDYVGMGNPVSLNISGTITVSAWAKFSTTNNNRPIVARWGTDQSYLLIAGGSDMDNVMAFAIRVGDVNKFAQTTQSYNDGLWHHYTGLWDGSRVYLYVDGGNTELIAGDTTSGPIDTPATNVVIGAYNDPMLYFNGFIDDVRIYNRALSAQEVANLYNSAKIDYK